MYAPGSTIAERFSLNLTPDALPVVRVFRNGARSATATVTGSAGSYLVTYVLPSGWATTDLVRLVAYPLYGGESIATPVWAGRLGAYSLRSDETSLADALVLDVTPDATPTAGTWLDGLTSVAGTVAAGFDAKEFVVTVNPVGLVGTAMRATATVVTGGISGYADLWHEFLTNASAAAAVTAELVWSLPEDRNAGTVAAVVATRQDADTGQQTDLRLVFDAAGPAALSTDLATMTLAAYVALNTLVAPVLTLTEGSGITVNSVSQFEVAFPVTTANGLSPGVMVLSVYDITPGARTWLANVVVTAANTALNP